MIDSDSLSSNYVSAEFAAVSLGYLGLHVRRLSELLDKLPEPRSARERAIVYAVRWGVDNPVSWEAMRRRRVFDDRPGGRCA